MKPDSIDVSALNPSLNKPPIGCETIFVLLFQQFGVCRLEVADTESGEERFYIPDAVLFGKITVSHGVIGERLNNEAMLFYFSKRTIKQISVFRRHAWKQECESPIFG